MRISGYFNSMKGAVSGKILLAVLVVIVAAAAVLLPRFLQEEKPRIEFQKGMGYVSWSNEGYITENSDESLKELSETGCEWVSILVTWYQTDPWSSDIQKTEKTPTDESIIHVIRRSHELGMKVMLKPHLDLLDKSDGSWRGEIGCLNEAGWDEWFKKYEQFLMYYVKIAKKEKVEMICVGTELSCTATVKGYMWDDMIKNIRAKYNGLLTYAAHWDRYQDIRFWDKLDFIGINAYFPLTEKQLPTYEELKEGWKKWVKEMEEFQQKIGRPVIFPEIGCNSADGAAIRPWEHVTRSEVNLQLQADYYRALLDTFWGKEWFYGPYWWYWGTNVHMGGEYNRGFTPQNKPAEEVLKKWYSKRSPR
jgi:hypothetical protein